MNQPARAPEQASGIRIAPASNAGNRAIAGAVGGIVDEMANIQADLLERQTRLDVNDAVNDYGTKMAEVENRLDPNNPLGWAQEIRQGSQEFIDGMADRRLSPAAKEMAQIRLGDYEAKLQRQIMFKAKAQQTRKMVQQFQNRDNELKAIGDYEGRKELAKEYVPLTGGTDEDLEGQLQRIDEESEREVYASQIADGNFEFFSPDQDLPYLSDADQAKAYMQAEAQNSRMTSKEMEMISDLQLTGEIKTEADLERALSRANHLSQKDKDVAMAQWRKIQPVSQAEKYGLLDKLNEHHDNYKQGKIPKSIYVRRFEDTAKKVFALGSRQNTGSLRKKVYELDPANWKEGTFTSSKIAEWDSFVESLGSAYKSNLLRGDEKPTLVETTNALTQRSLVEGQLKKWVSENQKMLMDSPEAEVLINNEFLRLSSGGTVDSILQNLKTKERDADLEYFNSLYPVESTPETGVLPPMPE